MSYGKDSRRCTIISSTLSINASFCQSNLVDHVECLLKLFELCSIETFLEDANNLIICLDGHHFNEGHLASTYGT